MGPSAQGSKWVRLEYSLSSGPHYKGTDRVSAVTGSTAWGLTQKLTPSTLKSYPQTWHPGAFSKSSASKEDSPFMPGVRGKRK